MCGHDDECDHCDTLSLNVYMLMTCTVIGIGNFGEVRRGKWQNITVAMKGMRESEASELQKFKAEILMLW